MAYRFMLRRTGSTPYVDNQRGWILDFASAKDALTYLEAYNEMLELLGYPARLESPDIPIEEKVENIEFEWI